MSYQNIKTLKGQVKHCLELYPDTRNSDIALTIQIWREFYPNLIFESQRYYGSGGKHDCISLQTLYELPREDNVKRARAYWQNVKKLYPPTDLKIARARGMEEDEWRVAMGYPTKETAGTPAPSWTPPSERIRHICNERCSVLSGHYMKKGEWRISMSEGTPDESNQSTLL